ncbi:prolyl oligopeptidase family serine peptidase [Kallotenue papyrolyticum]|uniref:prolyl oligopeptidase family serine peptidase n=1 Tax=Kallotenue papyrolyticum TaxID=1325125 RepID=UPI000478529A|nr:prolyl oligopeptidase family serine peptidase [Kallotenue papyrolyticum]
MRYTQTMRRRLQHVLVIGAALALVVLGWLLTTDHPAVWPVRNVLLYQLLTRRPPPPPEWAALETVVERVRPPSRLALPADLPRGALAGAVRGPAGQPIAGATVLVAARDGTTWSAESDAQGRYHLTDVAVGSYIPVAGAPGWEDTAVRTLLGIQVHAAQVTPFDITLRLRRAQPLRPASEVRLSPPVVARSGGPILATALRRELQFRVGARRNQLTLVYTPDDGRATPLPVLLAVYPGPADSWESVSLPLAEAGFVVVAVGPAYALDLEQDVDDLLRVIALARAGQLPRADGRRIGALGGSYSGLHVLRLAVREPQALDAALLLGAPTDAFELRRQFEAGTFNPPFGLDRALIALGLPSQVPERYFRYSARYHARAIQAPLMLIHSDQDEIVPVDQSVLLAAELARLGKPHELRILRGMPHYLFAAESSPALDDLFATTLDFLRRELMQAERNAQPKP